MKTDKELADELDARKRLIEHGLTQEKCPNCKGLGETPCGWRTMKCYSCDGKGYIWKQPMMRMTSLNRAEGVEGA